MGKKLVLIVGTTMWTLLFSVALANLSDPAYIGCWIGKWVNNKGYQPENPRSHRGSGDLAYCRTQCNQWPYTTIRDGKCICGHGFGGGLNVDRYTAEREGFKKVDDSNCPNGMGQGIYNAVYWSNTHIDAGQNCQLKTIVGGAGGFTNGWPVSGPYGVTPADNHSGDLLVVDTGRSRIVRMKADGTGLTVVAGSGRGYRDGDALTEAMFDRPRHMALCPDGGIVLADRSNQAIRYIKDGQVTTIGGQGKGNQGYVEGPPAVSKFDHPYGVYCKSNGDILVADSRNGAVRLITKAGYVTSTIFGGTGADCDGNDGQPCPALKMKISGELTAVEEYNGVIWIATTRRLIKVENNLATAILNPTKQYLYWADGPGTDEKTAFYGPDQIRMTADGKILIADRGMQALRLYDPVTNILSTYMRSPHNDVMDGPVAGGVARWKDGPFGVGIDNDGHILITAGYNAVAKITCDNTVQPRRIPMGYEAEIQTGGSCPWHPGCTDTLSNCKALALQGSCVTQGIDFMNKCPLTCLRCLVACEDHDNSDACIAAFNNDNSYCTASGYQDKRSSCRWSCGRCPCSCEDGNCGGECTNDDAWVAAQGYTDAQGGPINTCLDAAAKHTKGCNHASIRDNCADMCGMCRGQVGHPSCTNADCTATPKDGCEWYCYYGRYYAFKWNGATSRADHKDSPSAAEKHQAHPNHFAAP